MIVYFSWIHVYSNYGRWSDSHRGEAIFQLARCGHIQTVTSAKKKKKSRNQEKCGALSYSVVYKFHTVQDSGSGFRFPTIFS